jgi:hypothetical protein
MLIEPLIFEHQLVELYLNLQNIFSHDGQLQRTFDCELVQ